MSSKDFPTPSSKTGANLTQLPSISAAKNRTAVSVDWFQCTLKKSFKDLPLKTMSFELKIKDFRTSNFLTIAEVFYNDLRVFHLSYNPSSSFMSPNIVLLKVFNEVLYTHNWSKLLQVFLSEFQLIFNNLTRYDIAIDFTEFLTMAKPERLIHRFLKSNIIKSNKGQFKVIGDNSAKMEFEYIRFGANSSDFSAYLYNKSKELDQVKTKPYINAFWDEQGLNQEKEVWRLEFSVKVPKLDFMDFDGTILNSFHDYRDFTPHQLYYLLTFLMEKYFKFYKNEGKNRRDRNKHIKLLDFGIYEDFKVPRYCKSDGSRSDKVFLNKILRNDAELRVKAPKLAKHFQNIAVKFAEQRGLSKYLENRPTKKK